VKRQGEQRNEQQPQDLAADRGRAPEVQPFDRQEEPRDRCSQPDVRSVPPNLGPDTASESDSDQRWDSADDSYHWLCDVQRFAPHEEADGGEQRRERIFVGMKSTHPDRDPTVGERIRASAAKWIPLGLDGKGDQNSGSVRIPTGTANTVRATNRYDRRSVIGSILSFSGGRDPGTDYGRRRRGGA